MYVSARYQSSIDTVSVCRHSAGTSQVREGDCRSSLTGTTAPWRYRHVGDSLQLWRHIQGIPSSADVTLGRPCNDRCTTLRRQIADAENFNRLSRAHERTTDRQQTDRQTDGRWHIANGNVSSRSLKIIYWIFELNIFLLTRLFFSDCCSFVAFRNVVLTGTC